MSKNIKFIMLLVVLIISSCGQENRGIVEKNVNHSPFADKDFKYNSIYNKLVVELLIHKDKYNEALEVFTANIQYFQDEKDFYNMINKARDMRQFQDINKITQRWIELDPLNISAHKIAFSNSIELEDFISADRHFDIFYKSYEQKRNKSYIDFEDILSRNIVIANIVEYFEQRPQNFDSNAILISYINLLQKNNLDQSAVMYLKEMDFKKNRTLLRKYSKSLSKLNDVDEAIRILEEYQNSLSFTDRETSFELLELYLKNNDIDKTKNLIQYLIDIDPSDVDFMFRIALLCFDRENFDLSEKYFNILLSKSYAPDNINFFLGQIDYANGRYNEALLHYERIQQGTFINTKHLNVARALLQQYDTSRAADYLDNHVRVKTKNDILNLMLLKLSIYQDPYNVDMVLETTTKIIESFPKNERALYSRALAYEKKGDLKNMIKDFEKMIKLDPYNSVALNGYGYSLSLHNKQLDYAERLIRRAIDIDPGNPAILDSLAWILYLDGSYKDAYKYATLAYQKDQDPEIVSHYYKILLKNGLKEKARKILKQSLIDNPNNNDLLELLDDITNEAAQL